ncbi:MAG: histidinol-phosphatase HisJ family protein [Ruminococcaceae bacterium]|nr:histidinol-phosphatase HisJ family protein [Oscillospiraceae bacterium]
MLSAHWDKNMKSNLHTHTTYCDGKNNPEEIVVSAIKHGFDSIGFSGHGYTDFDPSYCMKDTDGYIREIKALREKYKKDICIYLGIEEDAFCLTDREKYDYIIGSCHYICKDGRYYPVDSSIECMKECVSAFDGDVLKLAEVYYSSFCEYILSRKPDVIGHFDLITKFDEVEPILFLNNAEYIKLATGYIKKAAQAGSLFEVNTGAISRGYRKTPYPQQELLYTLLKLDAGIVLSSDSHSADTLDFAFPEAKALLRDIGFKYTYILQNNEFVKDCL